MTPESQRVALAKWAGWETCGDCDPCVGGRPDQCAIYPPPNYLHDLNAVAQLEERLVGMEDEPWKQYVVFLGGICYEPLPPHLRTAWHDSEEFQDWLCFRATAAQRCEALLRTLGLWED